MFIIYTLGVIKKTLGKDKKIGEKIIAAINRNVRAIQWDCLIEECSEKAINSHILQKNGVLNNIASNGHIYEIKPIDVFKWNGRSFGSITAFKKIGLNQAHSYRTLCNQHDTDLFLPIETHPLDFNNYQINLLFAFRTLLSMIRKEEIVKERETRIVNSATIKSNPNAESALKYSQQNLVVIEELLKSKIDEFRKFKIDLESENKNFEFISLSYPLKEVYASSIHLSPNQLETIYINIFPYDGESKILIIYPVNSTDKWTHEYLDSWTSLSEDELEKRLSTHLIMQCENWGISENIYENLTDKKQKELIKISQDNLFNTDTKFDLKYRVDYNLFKEVNAT
jgi:hypothetical protein